MDAPLRPSARMPIRAPEVAAGTPRAAAVALRSRNDRASERSLRSRPRSNTEDPMRYPGPFTSPPPANATCPPPAALRTPVAPRSVTDTPPSRPRSAPCARRAAHALGWRFMNGPGCVRAVSLLLLVASLGSLFVGRSAQTLPLYAARTGNLCGQCHFDPNGGGPRNDYGFMFARNRHSLDADTTGAWKDLNLTNKIGENMPVYIGVNQRFMLITNTSSQSDSLDRAGFFNMESAIYLTFKPHDKLTLVYSRDGFNSDP